MDATNYLGGTADVLERKDHRVDIDHSRALAPGMAVPMAGNSAGDDKEVTADRIRYRPTVQVLLHG